MNEGSFRLLISEIFHLADGRTILAGRFDEGEFVQPQAGECRLIVDGILRAEFRSLPEPVFSRSDITAPQRLRAIATRDKIDLSRDDIDHHVCIVEGPMALYPFRHLIGVDSPPDEYVPDTLTLGPRLPSGWDGDAWMHPAARGYFLRAWEKSTGRWETALADTYEVARTQLLRKIHSGTQRSVVHLESVGSS